MRFCSPGCKQAAWRSRNAKRAVSGAGGTHTHAAVTRPSEPIDNIAEFRTEKTTEPRLSDLIEIEVFAPHRWEDRISSDGVPIKVARLQSVLVRHGYEALNPST
jgi:hypothetical protein